jgi:hypothetical protein
MRKVRPQDVRDDFDHLVSERLAHLDRVEIRLVGTPNEKRDLSILSETTLHSSYVAFECFLSDLLLAYINRDFSQYQINLGTKVDASVTAKFGTWAAGRMSFNSVKHITLQQLESMLDPDSYNLTFKDVAALKQRFHDWVAAPHKNAVVSLNDSDTRLINCAHSIRNFIAHRSKNAKKLMNDHLAAVSTGPTCPNANLARGVREINDIGSYLKTKVTGTRRIKTYIMRLKAIAAAL